MTTINSNWNSKYLIYGEGHKFDKKNFRYNSKAVSKS